MRSDSMILDSNKASGSGSGSGSGAVKGGGGIGKHRSKSAPQHHQQVSVTWEMVDCSSWSPSVEERHQGAACGNLSGSLSFWPQTNSPQSPVDNLSGIIRFNSPFVDKRTLLTDH